MARRRISTLAALSVVGLVGCGETEEPEDEETSIAGRETDASDTPGPGGEDPGTAETVETEVGSEAGTGTGPGNETTSGTSSPASFRPKITPAGGYRDR